MGGNGVGGGRLALFITTRARPGKRDELLALWEEHLKGRVEENPAQEVYAYCLDREDPDLIHLYEVYSDASVMSEAAEAEWFEAYMEKAAPLMAGPPEIVVADPVWEKLP